MLLSLGDRENRSFILLHNGSPEVQRRTRFVPLKRLNSYPPGICANEDDTWSPGDFILHAPNHPNVSEVIQEYLTRVLQHG